MANGSPQPTPETPGSRGFALRGPMLTRMLIWLLLAGGFMVLFWPRPSVTYDWRFRAVGNQAHLWAVAGAQPEDRRSEAPSRIVWAHQAAPGEAWGDIERRVGQAASAVAWGDELVVLYADGGLRFFGPGAQGYEPSPVRGVGAWHWVAAAAEPSRLTALGLGGDGELLYAERGPEAWGDVTPVDLTLEWSPELSSWADAALREGEFHVVWGGKAVSETPLEEAAEPQRKLNYAFREPGGQWQGPFSNPSIRLIGRPSVAPFGPKLAMVYLERGEDGAEVLAYAEFTPGDRSWHRLRTLELPEDAADLSNLAGYGLAAFGQGHTLLLLREDQTVEAFRLDADTGALTPAEGPEPLRIAAGVSGSDESVSSTTFLIMLGAFVVLFFLLRALQRRAVQARLASSDDPKAEAAQMMADQMARIMYLPVLLRRAGAAALDTLLVLFASGLTFMVVQLVPATRGLTAEQVLVILQEHPFTVAAIVLVELLTYHILMEGLLGRTLGKLALGVRVVRADGGPPTWRHVIVRNLLRPLDMFPFPLMYLVAAPPPGLIGLLLILVTRRNQRLGDLVGGTTVVRSGQRPSGGPSDSDTRIT